MAPAPALLATLLLMAAPFARPAEAAGPAAPTPAIGAAVPMAAPAAAAKSAAAMPAEASPAAAKAPAAEAPAGGRKQLKIGCILPLSGDKAEVGRAAKAAIQMALEAANKRAPGLDFTLVCEDTKCTDVAALNSAKKLARSNVAAIVGDICSEASLGAIAVANRFQIPLISPASTSTILSSEGNYFFRTVPTDRYQGQFAASQVRHALGANLTVVAFTLDTYGRSLAFNFVAAYSKDGGEVVPVELPYAPSPAAAATAVAEVVAKVRESRAAGLFLATNDARLAADIIKTVRAASPKVKIYVGDALLNPTLPKLAGAQAVAGVRGTDLWYRPEFKSDFERFVKERGLNVTYVAKAASAYDATNALLDAIRRAPDPKSGTQIRKELFDVKFTGKSGAIAFDSYGDLIYDPATAFTVSEFQKGSVVPLPATKAPQP